MLEKEYLVRELGKLFDGYEVCLLRERTKKYESAERDLYGLEVKEEEGIALRAIKGDRLVFAYTYEKGEKAVASLLEHATTLVPFMERDENVTLPERHDSYPEFQAYDAGGLRTDDRDKISAAITLEQSILEYDKRIVKTRNCELQEVELSAMIFNSNGLHAEAQKTIYTLGGLCVAVNGEEVSWNDWSWSHRLHDLTAASLGRKIAEKAVSFLDGKVLETGVYDGLLTPLSACEMLAIVAPSFLAENLHKKKTWLWDQLGKQCFSQWLSLTDSGLAGMGSFPFDGEGVPSQVNGLVREGYFQGFLYDVYYGRTFGKPSTGNGVRPGIKEPPKCAPRGFFIEQGTHDVANTFQDGIIIEELMGAHTANPITGDFSLGAVGYLCRQGERVPFKGVMFSGNIFELLKSVKGVGNDLIFYGMFGSPTLFVEGLRISGT